MYTVQCTCSLLYLAVLQPGHGYSLLLGPKLQAGSVLSSVLGLGRVHCTCVSAMTWHSTLLFLKTTILPNKIQNVLFQQQYWKRFVQIY